MFKENGTKKVKHQFGTTFNIIKACQLKSLGYRNTQICEELDRKPKQISNYLRIGKKNGIFGKFDKVNADNKLSDLVTACLMAVADKIAEGDLECIKMVLQTVDVVKLAPKQTDSNVTFNFPAMSQLLEEYKKQRELIGQQQPQQVTCQDDNNRLAIKHDDTVMLNVEDDPSRVMADYIETTKPKSNDTPCPVLPNGDKKARREVERLKSDTQVNNDQDDDQDSDSGISGI